MCCGDASIFSVGGMEATFLKSGMAIGEGSTPVLVGGGYRFIDVGIRIVSEYISGSIGRRIGHGWLIACCCVCCFVRFFGTSWPQ